MPPKRVRSGNDAPAPAVAPTVVSRTWALREGTYAEIGPIPLHGSPEAEILRPEKRRKTRAAARESACNKPAFTAGLDETGKFTDWWTTYGLDSYNVGEE
jgi:hypothetical protein